MTQRMTRLALAVVLLVGAPATANASADTYQWAALGDSYTAGVFIGDPQPALGAENRDGCDRTTNSYPDLVNRELAEFPPGRTVELTDYSCGGAEIRHIAGEDQQPVSPVDAPGAWPLVSPQVERAQLDDETDVVTIGVGGNSLPFAGMLAKCVQLGLGGGSCREYYENPTGDEEGIDAKFNRIESEYVEMLARVHDAAPRAKVITVGYPAVLPQEGTDCALGDWRELVAISHADVDWLRGVLERLNQSISKVSGFFGDQYVDVYSSSVGHDACQPAEEKWVEGICGDAADYWPTEIHLPGLTVPCPEGSHATLVHPNAEGHQNVAYHVERAIRIALLD
ncbi:SGNH/GDSL hydrolase family protein [Actinosynnema sp. NPDC051121]